MRRFRVALVAVALLMAGGVVTPVSACPMCKIAHEDAEDPAVAARPKAYMYSILFMLSMPASLTTVFGVTFYRLMRKQAALNAESTDFEVL